MPTCAWCGVAIFISVEDPVCNDMHFACIWDRKDSRDRKDDQAQREAAQDRSAALRKRERGLTPNRPEPEKPEPPKGPPEKPKPLKSPQLFIPDLPGKPAVGS